MTVVAWVCLRVRMFALVRAAVVTGLMFAASGLAAQAAATYEERYGEVRRLKPDPTRVALVSGLELRRDVARFSLQRGTLALLTNVGGRAVGAAFTGDATFSFTPPTQIERDRLAHFEGKPSLTLPVSRLVLLFGDSTLAELERTVSFAPGDVPSGLAGDVRTALRHLGDERHDSFHPDLMEEFLNGDSSALFFAHIVRSGGGDLEFMLNPAEVEGVTLAKWIQRGWWFRDAEVITQFPAQGAAATAAGYERHTAALIRDYRLDVTLAQTLSGDLSFAAAARIEIAAQAAAGPWVPFQLFHKLGVDSVRWEDGRPATFAKGKDDDIVWLRLDRRLEPGETRALTLYYRGDLIDRYGNHFYIKTSVAWYPRSLEGRGYATFDITYHAPRHLLLASVGEQRADTVDGRVRTTRWTANQPMRNASFNVGQFEELRVQEPGSPLVIVLVPDGEVKRNKDVGADVAQSLKFFQHLFGPPPSPQLVATEIPAAHGEAFPGLLHLSTATFGGPRDQEGAHQMFRAHEVAHQWWGIGVDFATYHDQWLSEGMATFAGLWYMHAARKDSEKYFRTLRTWRDDILRRREEPSTTWLGYRNISSKDTLGYSVLVYHKGAWILHMLRILMFDLKTGKEDAFTGMLRDFYTTHQGGRASTEDFQRVVERHIGTEMDWFFNQWVYGAEIPTYRLASKTEPVDGGRYRVTLRVDQEGVADDFRMYVPVTVDLDQNRQARFRVEVKGPRSEIALPLLPGPPTRVNFNELEGVLCEVKKVAW